MGHFYNTKAVIAYFEHLVSFEQKLKIIEIRHCNVHLLVI